MTGRLVGPVALLQVQRLPLKATGREYDPRPLLQVERAWVGPEGMAGFHGGSWVLDVHHAAHPARRHSAGRAVSLGFTGHYRLMAAHFGAVAPGVGGENIVVEAAGRFHVGDVLGRVVVRGAAGEVVLEGAQVAAPCLPFTSFLLGLDRVAGRAEVAEHLEFLDDGMRGFVLGVPAGTPPAEIRLGDEVWWRPAAPRDR